MTYSDECMRNLHYGMVPMAIHKVVGRICISLVEIIVAVSWRFDRALDILGVHQLGLVR